LEHRTLPWPAPDLVAGFHSVDHVLHSVSYDLKFGHDITSDLRAVKNAVEVTVLSVTAEFYNIREYLIGQISYLP
jgi:hypothetical protein